MLLQKTQALPICMILEAEEATHQSARERKDIPGFAGEVYLIFRISDDGAIEWSYDAPSAGNYTLAIRYATTKERSHINLTLIGELQIPKLLFWNTGGDSVWKQATRTVQLITCIRVLMHVDEMYNILQ